MTQPTATAPPGSDLKTLVTGAEGDTLILKDKYGKEHVLPPLDLSDMVEFEQKTASTVLDAGKINLRLSDICFLLYLSMRKEGCSEEQLNKRNFKHTERQVYMMFDLGMLAKASQIFLDLLKISGVDLRPQEARPTTENPPVAQ